MVWEQRWHPLREEWVVLAAHRQDRPWSGQTVDRSEGEAPAYEPGCHLCPGNVRVSGVRNPSYEGVFAFENDHPCVGEGSPAELAPVERPYRNRRATGVARVVCYSPLHNAALAELEVERVVELVRTWQAQYVELGSRAEVNHVLVFENRGEAVGVSNPHPHCQIYATNFVFKTIANEVRTCRRYFRETGRVLLEDAIAAERGDGRRVLAERAGAIGFLPYFARYAYESFVAPKRCCASVAELSDSEVRDFAAVLREVVILYDNLWRMPFPYVMALHQAPTDGGDHGGFHFHAEFHPPLRKPDLLKYLAGPEIGGGCFLNDTSPERKAAELRALPRVHYRRGEAGR